MPGIYHDYLLIPISGGAIRAVLPVIIFNPYTNLGETIYCFVDSGADACIINGELAIRLGHDLKGNGVESDIKIGLDEREVITYRHTFILKLLDQTSQFTIWESNQMLFECIESSNLPILLGTKDFLSNFKITFNYPQGILTIEL
jgi:hypothetical protein